MKKTNKPKLMVVKAGSLRRRVSGAMDKLQSKLNEDDMVHLGSGSTLRKQIQLEGEMKGFTLVMDARLVTRTITSKEQKPLSSLVPEESIAIHSV